MKDSSYVPHDGPLSPEQVRSLDGKYLVVDLGDRFDGGEVIGTAAVASDGTLTVGGQVIDPAEVVAADEIKRTAP